MVGLRGNPPSYHDIPLRGIAHASSPKLRATVLSGDSEVPCVLRLVQRYRRCIVRRRGNRILLTVHVDLPICLGGVFERRLEKTTKLGKVSNRSSLSAE